MIDDSELLSRYVRDGSEDAFTELVRRHLDLVYSAACRQVGGDLHRAQDVAQAVFADLARKAPSLSRHTALTGWLYTSTHFTAAKLRRTEQRRLVREQEAHAMQELLSPNARDADWERLRPVLDTAMHELNRPDREAVLLRFFENRSFGEVGRQLGLGENAARMRVERALDKLGGLLAKRGVTSATGALSLVLTNQAVAAAPGGMAASVASGALGQAAAAGGSVGLIATAVHLMTTTKFTLGAAGLAGLLAISTTFFYASRTARAETVLATSSREADALRARLRAVGERIAVLESDKAAKLTPKVPTAAVEVTTKETANDRAMHEMMNDPTVTRLIAQREMAGVSRRFGRFYREMDFSPLQIEQFEARLEAAMTDSYRAHAGAIFKGYDITLPFEADDKIAQIRAGFEQEIRRLFGDNALQRFLEQERLEPAHEIADEVAGKVFFSDTPLTAAQANDLTRILAAHSPQYAAGEPVSRVRLDWEKAMAEAARVLTPTQLAALQAVQTRTDFEAKVEAATAQASGRAAP